MPFKLAADERPRYKPKVPIMRRSWIVAFEADDGQVIELHCLSEGQRDAVMGACLPSPLKPGYAHVAFREGEEYEIPGAPLDTLGTRDG